jgi:hypothetical protein
VPIARTTVQTVPKEEFTTDVFCDHLLNSLTKK